MGHPRFVRGPADKIVPRLLPLKGLSTFVIDDFTIYDLRKCSSGPPGKVVFARGTELHLRPHVGPERLNSCDYYLTIYNAYAAECPPKWVRPPVGRTQLELLGPIKTAQGQNPTLFQQASTCRGSPTSGTTQC